MHYKSGPDRAEIIVDSIATLASVAGYAGLFSLITCGKLDLPADWWTVALAVASLLPLAIMPFLFVARRWPDMLWRRWIAAGVSIVILVLIAFLLSFAVPSPC